MKPQKKLTAVLKPEIQPFTLIGLSSHENDDRLACSLNTKLGLALTLDAPLKGCFTCYCHNSDELSCRLISNRRNNGFLINAYKQWDFFVKFDRKLINDDLEYWMNSLKSTPLVVAVIDIPVTKSILKVF